MAAGKIIKQRAMTLPTTKRLLLIYLARNTTCGAKTTTSIEHQLKELARSLCWLSSLSVLHYHPAPSRTTLLHLSWEWVVIGHNIVSVSE
eukprot:Ihof_evm8s295 gene=Ihof_evmTU8s295